MPLYKEWNPDQESCAAIWHINEPESFFSEKLSLSGQHIKHPQRRIEFLAGRYLLSLLAPGFPIQDIQIAANRKPFLPGDTHHFSISHSYPYVACYYHPHKAVGIDIQCWHEGILSLQQKFLSPAEQSFCNDDPQLITLAWCAKEAAFKFQNRAGVDFIQHLPISQWETWGENKNISINLNLLASDYKLSLSGLIFNDFALSYTQ